MKTVLIVIFSLFFYSISIGQSFKTIKSDGSYFFINSIGNINAIRIDSTDLLDNDTILFNFYKTRNRVINVASCELYGATWMGINVIIKQNGYNLFINKFRDTITIKTNAVLFDTWVAYKFSNNYYLEATISSFDTLTFLNIQDSVKTILFQVKNQIGDNIVHNLNSKQLKLSQHYGFIQMLDFYEFPYDSVLDVTSRFQTTFVFDPIFTLIGIPNSNTGIQDIKAKDVFNFNIGDEFHTENKVNLAGPGIWHDDHLITNIIAKSISVNQDTMFYTVKRCGKKRTCSAGSNQWVEEVINDTTQLSYILSSYQYRWLDKLPDEVNSIFGSISFSELSYNSNYNCRLLKANTNIVYHNSNPLCASSIVPGIGYYYYIEGCGEYYTGAYDWPISEDDHFKLTYFKKGDETWGTPYDCSTLLSISNSINQNVKVNLYPNPVEDISYLEIENLHEPLEDICLFVSVRPRASCLTELQKLFL